VGTLQSLTDQVVARPVVMPVAGTATSRRSRCVNYGLDNLAETDLTSRAFADDKSLWSKKQFVISSIKVPCNIFICMINRNYDPVTISTMFNILAKCLNSTDRVHAKREKRSVLRLARKSTLTDDIKRSLRHGGDPLSGETDWESRGSFTGNKTIKSSQSMHPKQKKNPRRLLPIPHL
jgi:hypothetical protein